MKRFRFQLRLIVSSVGGVAVVVFITPYVQPVLQISNLVVAGFSGALLFLLVTIVGGLIWRRAILAAPFHWAVAAPPVTAVTIYLGLRVIGGSQPHEVQLATGASLVAGFCAIFASAIFLVWAQIAPLQHDEPV